MLIKCCVNEWLFNDNHPSPRVYILFNIRDIQVTEDKEKQEILIFFTSDLNYHSLYFQIEELLHLALSQAHLW